jgi:type VI protein secretion system component Hcp
MSFNTDIYIAFRLQDRSTGSSAPYDTHPGWIHSGFNYSSSDVSTESLPAGSTTAAQTNAQATLPVSTTASPNSNFPDAPASSLAYARARSCEMQVKKTYAGINSSGGPQVAGRSDHSDVIVTRDCDLISPYLFQYCASGWQIQKVYIMRYIGSDTLAFNFCHEWVLTGVQVTDYQISHGRYFNECLNELTLYSRETVSLLYTSAKIRCSKFEGSGALNLQNGEFKGWDTATNTAIGLPP